MPPSPSSRADRRALTAVRLAHTAAWALFASCIVAMPVASVLGAHRVAFGLAAVVAGEVIVLACNRGRCPLTPIAARYTDDRAANFDIYLPLWLARHNKVVFGVLYVAGLVFAAAMWAWTG